MLKKSVRWVLDGIDRGLAVSARPSSATETPGGVFIVGAPRSGSTLLYQALLHSRRFAYINNFVAAFPRSGERVATLAHVGRWAPPATFDSDYGDTSGWAGPSEAGALWDAIFPWEHHHSVDAEELHPDQSARLNNLVRGISRAYGGPFLCKNLWHSVRIGAIASVLPRAVFIVTSRAPLSLAQSILKGRRRALGEGAGLWSVRPRSLLAFEASPPVEQVAAQIRLVYEEINRARATLGDERFLDVPYEEFCREPDRWIEGIDSFLEGHQIRAEPRGLLGRSFDAQDELTLDSDECQLLQRLLPRTLLASPQGGEPGDSIDSHDPESR